MLQAHNLTLSYGGRNIVEGLSLDIPEGGLSIIIGPNGCGKSTVLKALGRLLKPQSGQVTLGGRDISGMGTKHVAKHIGVLPQSPHAPDGVSVTELVSRGRYPHQHLLSQWSKDDESIVARSLAEVGMHTHAERLVSELSGGQRQRAWIAMALAQETDILLLDEPTTFLDVARVYTVRSFDAATESIVVDVVQHHHESPMMRWSDTVKINDTLVLTGPRPYFVIPEGEQAALFLDDTAIPALRYFGSMANRSSWQRMGCH